ncbi:alpha/beta fold hydrolase [Streptomyces sp. NPDC021224]|uniref:alpha/beta fold hydrolase n=1 Tax=unclassified Streptomyces TaxID=2593676 RepID=UPI0037A0152D
MAGPHTGVTAFRGTEPQQIMDWLTDATTPPSAGPGGMGCVHYGFAQAPDSIWPKVRAAIEELRDQGQRVYFTGHSLGGALAMLAAARTVLEDPELAADGVYTYGQPRTCDRLLATAYDKGLKGRVFRFVNDSDNDNVPTLPPPNPATPTWRRCATSTTPGNCTPPPPPWQAWRTRRPGRAFIHPTRAGDQEPGGPEAVVPDATARRGRSSGGRCCEDRLRRSIWHCGRRRRRRGCGRWGTTRPSP